MLLRSSFLLVASFSCYSQTAITELSSFWEMDVSQGVAWDSHENRHALFIGRESSKSAHTAIFGTGIKLSAGSLSVPADLLSTAGSFSFAVWCRATGPCVSRWKDHLSVPQKTMWAVGFSASGRAQVTGDGLSLLYPSGSYDKSADQLGLVWFLYDAGTGQISVAIDDSSATSTAAPDGWSNSNAYSIDIAHARSQFSYGATVGRMMFWDGYLPSDAERAAIWNSGNGREYTYFNAAGFTPPAQPLTVSLINETFAVDSELASQGLYWLRPYPLKTWSPSLISGRGDYVWLRSTDHQTGNGTGGIWMGYSDSPEVLPASWTKILDAAALSASDLTYNWYQLETPYLAWNPETEVFHLYAHAVRAGSSGPVIQVTHVWTSPDLSTWTWVGPAFPNAAGRNHTGYATVERRGTGDWIANTLATDATATPSSTNAIWTSTDGLTWAVAQQEAATVDHLFNSQAWAYSEYGRNERINNSQLLVSWNYIGYREVGTSWGVQYPVWKLFAHDGTGTGGDQLQDVRAYEENGTVWLYAKWSYQEPSTIRLYKGTLPQSSSPRFGGALRIGGTASVK